MPFQRVKRPTITNPQAGLPSGQREKQNLKPVNERLWHLLTLQAKARFVKYPSPTASAWVHKKYLQMGGKFVDTAAEGRRNKAAKAAKEIADKHREAKHHKKKGK